MRISFFEEYPTKENLAKLKLVSWPTNLYIAAKSIKEFNKIKASIKNKNVKKIVYWPILKKEEGYWFSPFTKAEGLQRALAEIKTTPVMIDAELPFSQNKLLFLTQLFNFSRNKKFLKQFVKNHPDVYSAEYYPAGGWKDALFKFLGIHHDPKHAKIIKMVYHSMHHFNEKFITNELTKGARVYGKNFLVAYGTIATGVLGNEPLLATAQLKKDLEIAKKAKVNEVIMFRLGGLNKEYASLMGRFAKSP